MESARIQLASDLFPPEITSLPKVEVPIDGVTGFCVQDEEKQLVFFVFEEGVSFPDHSHCEQRGLVVSGEMIIDIEGQINLFQTGDQYRVPQGVKHRTSFTQRTALIDLSDAPDRYPVGK